MTEEEVLAIKTINDLRKLTLMDFWSRDITEREVDHILKICNAKWIYSGNPKDPHAELTDGFCAKGYIDTLRALRYTNICEILATKLARKIRIFYQDPIDWVIGSDHAGAAFSHSVAIALGAQHDFTEKRVKE